MDCNSKNERLTLFQSFGIYFWWTIGSLLTSLFVCLLISPLAFVCLVYFKDSFAAMAVLAVSVSAGLFYMFFLSKWVFHKVLLRVWKHFRIESSKEGMSWWTFLKFMALSTVLVTVPIMLIEFLGAILEHAYDPQIPVEFPSKTWQISGIAHILNLFLMSFFIRWFISRNSHLYRVRQIPCGKSN